MNKIIGINIEDGNKIYFNSQSEAEEKGGFCSAAINMCLNNKRKSHKGYIWRREDKLGISSVKIKKLGRLLAKRRGVSFDSLMNELLREELRKELKKGDEILEFELEEI